MIITDITNIGDPQIVLHDGFYYCYATSFVNGFYVWHSRDLICWSEPEICFEPENHWADCDYWAPEVVYHNGKFIMHYTAREKGTGTLRLGVAISDTPKGPFVDALGGPLLPVGYANIDGSVYVGEEGNFLYFSRDCSQNYVNGVKTSQIYCVRLDDTLTHAVSDPELMTTPTEPWELKSLDTNHLWNEGPCVVKFGTKYVMNYSANCYATNDYAICIATADSPLGPWIKAPEANPVLSCAEELFGAGHNAFFRTKEGKLMTAFHIQTDPEHPSGNRRACIGEVIFSEDSGIVKQMII